MVIIGCDYHPSMQQIAWCDEQSGQRGERRLEHSSGEAERFYRELKQRGVAVRVGIEACGHTRWFERMLAELEIELWIGNPAKIAAQRVRKQKTDRGGGGPIGGALRCRLASSFCAPRHAPATQPRHRRHGAQVGRKFVLAVAQRRRSAGSATARFARGIARLNTWCVGKHRSSDSGVPLPSAEGSLKS